MAAVRSSGFLKTDGLCSSCWVQQSKQQHRSVHFKASTIFGDHRLSLRRIRNHGSSGRIGRAAAVRAESGDGGSPVVGPWEPESPTGQLLVSLLHSHPHLFPAAAEQQIQQLAADRNAAASSPAASKSSSSGSELVLYKRIAEVKEQERHKAVVEVIYSIIVKKFLEAKLSLVPKIPSVPHGQKVDDGWGFAEADMEAVHSAEVLEVVRDHLEMILGQPSSHFQEPHTLVRASKMKIGHLYAATVLFGYFLRRLDQRYQLDRKALGDGGSDEARPELSEELDFRTDADGEKLAAEANAAVAAMQAATSAGRGGLMFPQLGWKPSKLKSYVKSLDPESLQRFAALRCKESLDVVERQTQAVFGKPEVEVAPDGSLVLLSGDSFVITMSGLRRLVLEAAAFGSFLWDAETQVDAQYNLVG